MKFVGRCRKFIRNLRRFRVTSILDAFRSSDRPIKKIVDPQFGDMWLNPSNVWLSTIIFPPRGCEVSLYLRDGVDGPTDWQRNCFVELVRRYPQLKKDMERPLWTEYEDIRRSWDLNCKAVEQPDQIWDVAHLVAVEINGESSSVDLSLDHQIDWENEDHDLNVFIKDWRILEVAMEG